MRVCAFRQMVSCVLPGSLCFKITSWAMLMIFPSALFAGETTPAAAMLYSHGDATLNGSNIPRSSALFSGDLIQTRADSVANIDATGSTVLILNESLVEYAGNSVKLQHGGVRVSTTKLMATRVGGVTVSPAAGAWTEFEVKDVDGTVHIAARKGDLTITDGKGVATTLAQGQETTRDDTQAQTEDRKKKKRAAGDTIPGAEAGVLNSPVAIGIGAGVILGGTIWVLLQSDNPASPAKP